MKVIDLAPAPLGSELSIAQGCMARLIPCRPVSLRCSRGAMLVTIEGDSRDYQLSPGDELALPAGKLVLLEGEADFRLSVRPSPTLLRLLFGKASAATYPRLGRVSLWISSGQAGQVPVGKRKLGLCLRFVR